MPLKSANFLALLVSCLFICLIPGLAEGAEENGTVGKEFWAYRQPQKSSPPTISNPAWAHNEIDQFVFAAAVKHGLHPGADADRAVLVRRIYYDLIGLPPALEEMDEFLRDESAEAIARLIDRLMARPQFGERWGRHWLDVARFAESVTLRGLVFKEAWRYRDYVIAAFNRDLPYDQFIQQQVAGDLLPATTMDERQQQLVATTFLALGNWNLEEQDKAQLRMDVVDEQLDTLGKAFLAQTIGCARCHDHKFDPIPTRDYYAMAGILRSSRTLIDANVSTWVERPLPLDDHLEGEFKQRETAVAALQARIKKIKEQLAKAESVKGPSQEVVLAPTALPGIVVDDSQAKRIGDWRLSQYSRRYIGNGYLEDRNDGKGSKTLAFQPELPKAGKYEVRLAYVPGDDRAKKVPVTILSADGESTLEIDQQLPPPIDGRFVSLGQFRFEQNGQGFVLVSNEGTTGHVTADAVQFLSLELVESTSPATAAGPQVADPAPPDQRTRKPDQELKQMESELKTLIASGRTRPMVMSVRDEDIGDTYIHIRGSVHNPGDKAPRGFLQVANYTPASLMPSNQSGRLELAQWLGSSSNPLTARVMVNRVWHWLFGYGLVRTTDNFGTTGDKPSHPELLDYLAVRFMEQGWSVKWLLREMMLTHTYQLSSTPDPSALTHDPENRWLTRMNRRRLDAECLRDAMLSVSGQLILEQGGSTIQPGTASDYGYHYSKPRRSVYVPVLRNALPELFELFDFADPSVVTGARSRSTVAPQALFFMNHPFVFEQARFAATRTLVWPEPTHPARVEMACRLALGRPPTKEEQIIADGLFNNAGVSAEAQLEAWVHLYHALFASLDFRYLH